MIVNAYAADAGGCGHYRIIYPTQAIRDTDVSVNLFTEGDAGSNLKLVCRDSIAMDDWAAGRKPRKTVIVEGINPPECDVVIVQRPLLRLIVDAIPHLQRAGIAVVVEVDDDFQAIHPWNVAHRTSDPKASPESNRDHLARACRMADLVTVSTPTLAERYGKHGRVAVLPNCLPDSFFAGTRVPSAWKDQRLWVGWSGSLATHPTDLQQTGGAVSRAMRGTDAGLYVVGTGVGVRERLAYPDDGAWLPVGWTSIEDYPAAMAGMDIGIVPLELNTFNEAKSYLKGMEMAALGIPFIASPTHQYEALAALGAGLLARRPKNWEALMRKLIRDDAYRTDLAERGRVTVEPMRYTGQAWRWCEAWEQARINHAARRVEHVRSGR